MPTTSYWFVRISSTKRSSVGKSSSVQGASMLAWMSMMPQLRWNIRSENGPCVRVTWLWYSSIGFITPAAVLVVLGVGAEDAGQEDLRPRAQRMNGDLLRAGRLGVVNSQGAFPKESSAISWPQVF